MSIVTSADCVRAPRYKLMNWKKKSEYHHPINPDLQILVKSPGTLVHRAQNGSVCEERGYIKHFARYPTEET